MIFELIYAGLVLFFTFLVLFTIGQLVLSFLGAEKMGDHFFSLVIGMVFVVFCYSIVKSGFVTINLGFLIPLFFYVFFFKGKKQSMLLQIRPNCSKIGVFVLRSLFPVSLFFLINLPEIYSNGYYIALDGDLVYYSKISAFLKYVGIESHNPEVFHKVSLTPYHYFELWLNALLSEFSGITSLISLKLITIPLLQSIVFFGYIEFLKPYNIGKLQYWLFALLATLFSGFQPWFYKFIPLLSESDTFLIGFFTPKVLCIIIFIQAILILYTKNKKDHAVLVLSCLPMVSIATAPGILIGSCCFLVIGMLVNHKKVNKLWLVLFVGIAAFVVGFYVLGGIANDGLILNERSSLIEILLDKQYLMVIGKIIIGGTIQVVSLYLLPIVIIAVFYKTIFRLICQNKEFVLWVFLVVLFALFSWGILHYKMNSVQLFSVPVVVFLNTGLAFLFLHLYNVITNSVKKILIPFVMIILFGITAMGKVINLNKLKYKQILNYDSEFHEEIKRIAIENDRPIKAVFFSNIKKINTIFDKHLNVYWPSDFSFPLYSDKYFFTSLSFLQIPVSQEKHLARIEKELIAASPIGKYFNKKSGSLENVELIMVDFIKENNVELILAEQGAGVNRIISKLSNYRIIEDKTNGMKIYLLDR
jgi:hypothetical protein